MKNLVPFVKSLGDKGCGTFFVSTYFGDNLLRSFLAHYGRRVKTTDVIFL